MLQQRGRPNQALNGFQDMAEMVERLVDSTERLRHQGVAITLIDGASVGHRSNQVVKRLTILTSIFAPFSVIAGIDGKNIVNMPEFKWHYGYGLILSAMLVVAALQGWWLWRWGWFEDCTTPR